MALTEAQQARIDTLDRAAEASLIRARLKRRRGLLTVEDVRILHALRDIRLSSADQSPMRS